MKLKYQMRGLGIGIMVTALLMGVAKEKGIPLSDAEIRAKALELGMVESDAIRLTDLMNASPVPEEGGEVDSGSTGSSDADGENGSDDPENISEADGAVGSDQGSSQVDGGGESGIVPDQGTLSGAGSGDAASETGAQNGEDSPFGEEGEDTVIVVIEFGVTSDHVSEMLEELGLVEDAAAFDRYLCDNGYSRSITAGTYEITPGSSEEEIVKIITKTR